MADTLEQRARRFDIRVGDEWVYMTNTGGISRTIVFIGDGDVEYPEYGGARRVCAVSTFRRWWKGARLEYATDWSGRDVSP